MPRTNPSFAEIAIWKLMPDSRPNFGRDFSESADVLSRLQDDLSVNGSRIMREMQFERGDVSTGNQGLWRV